MSWLLRLLGYRDRGYRGVDFQVRLEPIQREVLSVIHTRSGISTNLLAEYIGKKWEGISVHIDPEIENTKATQIVSDLATAFEAMNCGYVIVRKVSVDIVPESEIQAAVGELRKMGFEIEILPDGRIRQSKVLGAPHQDLETIKKQTPRIMQLMQTVHGKRTRFETLAKSKDLLN